MVLFLFVDYMFGNMLTQFHSEYHKFTFLLILFVSVYGYGEHYYDYDDYGGHYEFAIVGTGRCGTKYISTLICELGLDLPHEHLGYDGMVSAYLAGKENLYSQNGFRTGYNLTFTHVFHQVRHPLRVISSFYFNVSDDNSFWEFVDDEIEEFDMTDSHIVKVAKYWYYWNLKAEEMAEWTFRIEDIDQVFDELCLRLYVPVNRELLKNISRETNHWDEVPPITWYKLRRMLYVEGELDLYEKIKKLALRYGYTKDRRWPIVRHNSKPLLNFSSGD